MEAIATDENTVLDILNHIAQWQRAGRSGESRPHDSLSRDCAPSQQDDANRDRKATIQLPARSATEMIVSDIWRELLGVEIGRTDQDFFELGGHSLLAIEVLAKVRDRTGVEIAPQIVFMEAFTIEALAAAIDAQRCITPQPCGPQGDVLRRP